MGTRHQRRPRKLLLATACAMLVAGAIAIPYAQSTGGEAYTTPRTAWGTPDIQGIWTNATLTPIERPATMSDQNVLTAEEAAAFET